MIATSIDGAGSNIQPTIESSISANQSAAHMVVALAEQTIEGRSM